MHTDNDLAALVYAGAVLPKEHECFVCASKHGLRICPIATGDRFGQEPERPICIACLGEWYDGEKCHDSWKSVRETRMAQIARTRARHGEKETQ